MSTTRSGKRSNFAAATMTGELSSENRRLLEEMKSLREHMSSKCTEFLSAVSLKNEVVGKLKGEVDAINAKVRKLESLV